MVAVIVAEEDALSSLRERGQGGVCMGRRSLGEPGEAGVSRQRGRLAKSPLSLCFSYAIWSIRITRFPRGWQGERATGRSVDIWPWKKE